MDSSRRPKPQRVEDFVPPKPRPRKTTSAGPMRKCARKLRSPETIRDAAKAAVIGALVADAAAQPTHWNYKTDALRAALADKGRFDNPEFMSPSMNKFYRLPTGSFTCYGDQAFVMLESLVALGGLEAEDVSRRYVDAFDENSDYGPLQKVRQRPQKRPWRNGSITDFIKKSNRGKSWVECGSSVDKQVDCMLRIIPVVALYAGSPELANAVDTAVCITQTTTEAREYAAAAAMLLESCILGTLPHDAVRQLSGAVGPMVATAVGQLLEHHHAHQEGSYVEAAAAVGKGAKAGGLA